MDPSLHFAIPFAVVLLLGFRLRWALVAGLMGAAPDLDILLFTHRSVTHSVLPAAVLMAVSALAIRKPRLSSPIALSAASWGSHSLLDFSEGYVPLLWPLSEDAYRLMFVFKLHMASSPSVTWTFEILRKPYDYGAFTILDASVLTAEGLVLAAIILAMSLAVRWNLRSRLKATSLRPEP